MENKKLGNKRGGRTAARKTQNARPLVYEPSVGTSIDFACKEATALAINHGQEVPFKFNDVWLVATPAKSWETLSQEWESECARQAEAYRNSPEDKQAAAERSAAIARKQAMVNALNAQLPAVLERGLDDTVRWIKAFTDPADDIAVNFNKDDLVLAFRAYGYKTNEHVGHPATWFNTRERIGRYLIGQVMNCLEHGMPPHSRSLFFCDKYFKTRKTWEAASVHSG